LVVDPFGIAWIYATNPILAADQEWYQGISDPARYEGGNVSGWTDGGAADDRMIITTSSLLDDCTTTDHSVWLERGYGADPRDFRNVEMTVRCRLNGSGDAHVSLFNRGGRHSGGSIACHGFKYTVGFWLDGTASIKKETWHVHYDTLQEIVTDVPNEFTFKYICYDTIDLSAVVIEGWIDRTSTNQWERVLGFVDSGYGTGGGNCGTAENQQGLWGGPNANLRWDFASGFQYSCLSVRPIFAGGISLVVNFPEGSSADYGDPISFSDFGQVSMAQVDFNFVDIPNMSNFPELNISDVNISGSGLDFDTDVADSRLRRLAVAGMGGGGTGLSSTTVNQDLD
jgi:hypothetical protein